MSHYEDQRENDYDNKKESGVRGVYTEKPKSGKGRKAWEMYELENGRPPASVTYTPNYECEYKGWICEWFGDDLHVDVGSNYGSSFYCTFYLSSEL